MSLNLTVEDESDNPEVRFKLDRRLIIPIISAVTYLLRNRTPEESKSFFLTINYDYENSELILEWNTANEQPRIIDRTLKNDFLEETTITLIDSFIKNYGSKLETIEEEEEGGYNVLLKVPCEVIA